MRHPMLIPMLVIATAVHAEPNAADAVADAAQAAKAFYTRVRTLDFPGLPKGKD